VRAGRNACAPLSARLDLRPPRSRDLYGAHRTIYLAGQTGIDANGKVAEGSRATLRASEDQRTGLPRPVGCTSSLVT
jgi:hypothetical protein